MAFRDGKNYWNPLDPDFAGGFFARPWEHILPDRSTISGRGGNDTLRGQSAQDRYDSQAFDWDKFYGDLGLRPAVGPGGEPMGPAIQGQGDPFMQPMSVEQMYEGILPPPLPSLPPSIPNRLTPDPNSSRVDPELPYVPGSYELTGEVDPVTGLRVTKPLPKPPNTTQTAGLPPIPMPFNMRPFSKGAPIPGMMSDDMRLMRKANAFNPNAPFPMPRRTGAPIPASLGTGGPFTGGLIGRILSGLSQKPPQQAGGRGTKVPAPPPGIIAAILASGQQQPGNQRVTTQDGRTSYANSDDGLTEIQKMLGYR